MSNYAPPTAPMGGPAGQPFPPQQSFPPPPEKKSKVLVWVLAGCGTFVVLGVIAVMALSYFVWNKAKEIEKNPAFAIAKMVVSANPDVELASTRLDKAGGAPAGSSDPAASSPGLRVEDRLEVSVAARALSSEEEPAELARRQALIATIRTAVLEGTLVTPDRTERAARRFLGG